MAQTQTSLLVFTTLLVQFNWAHSQPADLGTFGTQNDVQPGVIYSFPSEVGRLHSSADFYALAFINYTYTRQDGHQVVYAQETAKYGEGQISAVSGPLVHVTTAKDRADHTACSCDLRGTNGQPLPGKGWIALIKRGECKFDEKVACVYRNGAIGAIVYDFKEVPTLDKMKIDDKTRNITAVFTYKLVGEQLARIVDIENRKLNVSITPGKFGKPPNINRTSVLFVSISFIVLMIISFVWLVFYYVQRFRYLQTKDRKSRQLCTVAKRVIAKIPTKSIKSDETNDIDSDCCAICIEPYATTDVIRVLPCKHEFHKVCLDPWLLEHRTCPMCKLDILKHYGFVVSAQNQIINLNGFNLGASSSDSGPSPTAPPADDSIFSNQDQNQSNTNHSALTQSRAEHLIPNAQNVSPNTQNDNGGGSDSSGGGETNQILAIFPTSSQQSQLLNINSFTAIANPNANTANSNSNAMHHPDHLTVDNNSSSSSCSYNHCNSSLSSANNNTDNTRIPHSSCSNMQTFNNSFIDSTSHLNRNTARSSNPSNRVSDV